MLISLLSLVFATSLVTALPGVENDGNALVERNNDGKGGNNGGQGSNPTVVTVLVYPISTVTFAVSGGGGAAATSRAQSSGTGGSGGAFSFSQQAGNNGLSTDPFSITVSAPSGEPIRSFGSQSLAGFPSDSAATQPVASTILFGGSQPASSTEGFFRSSAATSTYSFALVGACMLASILAI